MSIQRTGPKVFGIGISRTGTTSLSKALHRLGYDTIHAPLSIIKRANGRVVLNEKAVMRYEAMTDSTVAFMYKELDAAFPGSKFVLTVRDVENWILSMRRVRKVYPILLMIPKVSQLFHEAFGDGYPNDEAAMRAKFIRHIQEVRAHFEGRNDLLVMDFAAGDGWEKLCRFLGRPVPDVTFPHNNKKSLVTFSNAWDLIRGIA
jgi:Sulfotransferase domain